MDGAAADTPVTQPKRGRGRPCLYTEEIADEIIERMSDGEPVASICRDEHMPHVRTVFHWTQADCRPPEVPATFEARFVRARLDGHDAIAADCIVIADTPQEGVETTTDDKGASEKRGDMLGHRKLRIEARLKLLAVWDRKRYGQAVALGGAEDLPPVAVDLDMNKAARQVAYLLHIGLQAKKDGA